MSSDSSISIKTIEFPEEYELNLRKHHCTRHEFCHGKLPIVHSGQLGFPAMMSIKHVVPKSSSIELVQPTTTTATTVKTSTKRSTRASTSRVLDDTFHKGSVRPKKAEFKGPCADSVVLGAPKPYIGNCPAGAGEKIPSKKKISLTEDPRKRFCLRNPKVLHFKPIPAAKEQAYLGELIKTAENIVTSSGSQSTISSICEVIDVTNPLNLDFQGMDYRNTYARDEQSNQNQMEYRKVRRFKHRRNLKEQTACETEIEQQEARIAIPQCFTVEKPKPKPKPVSKFHRWQKYDFTFGKLVRAEEKKKIKHRFEQEEENRKERYKHLYLKQKEKLAEKEEEEKKNAQNAIENNAKALADKDIADLIKILDRTITTKKRPPRQLPKRRDFPHTLRETLKFRHQMKKTKRVLRDKAKVKEEFYAQREKRKSLPATELSISSDTASWSPRDEEQSTDDEDDMQVGKKGSKFYLRGFLYRLGSNLRGKFHQKERLDGEKKVKGCMTREEWFETLVTKRKIEIAAQKQPPGMELFPPSFGLQPLHIRQPIREYRHKPLGRHYDRVIRRNLRIKQPKQVKVKKFSLIGYLYGVSGKKKRGEVLEPVQEDDHTAQTMDYMRNKIAVARIAKRMQKRRRMHYLGIPCPKRLKRRASDKCVDSDSEDSDWIPDETADYEVPHKPPELHERWNMPAPDYRETTLRAHPRHPRDYHSLRVPSAQFNDFVKHKGRPLMAPLPRDKYITENVRNIKKTTYGNKFEVRHHHDHWNPTQHKLVRVQYNRKIVKPHPMDVKKKEEAPPPKTFDKARPRAENVEEINFAMPQLDTDGLIKEYNSRLGTTSKTKTRTKEEPTPQTEDVIFHSLPAGKPEQFPGYEKFVNFLSEIKAELNKRAGIVNRELAIDKAAYLEELQEDLKSIESCLTSLSSSECTNLSNDSGSFLLAGDTKIPLDYLRKSLVPFEEMNHSRFEAIPIDPAKEELDPFRTVPFAGQEKEQIAMSAAKDSFFTFNTRLQNGMRLRLEVKEENTKQKLLGPRHGVKAYPQVATDIDELYIEDLRNRPAFKPFKWNSCRTLIKDALRKKFESMLIQGEIVRTKIYDRRNEMYFQQMMKMKNLFEKLFAKWEKKEYEAAMEVVHKVKPYYEATDKYRQEYQELGKLYTVLNMDIVYIENDWMRRTILQNFHYLLAAMEWRVENDWIHRTEDGELESFEESIAKRSTTNIRARGKDDAWAIKEYYDNVYLKNYHPIVVVFKDAKEFIAGIDNLKSKTFVLLLELHYTLWILAELDQKYQDFSDWCVIELESKKTYAENKCANKYYMEDRANKLKAAVHEFLGKPIDKSFSSKKLCHMKGICKEVYKDVVPVSEQMDVSPLEQVAAISQVLIDILGKFEHIPVDVRNRVEKKYRRLYAYHHNLSRQAVLVERRIISEMVRVRRNLAPPYVKPKRTGKLPRSELKRVVRRMVQKPVIISDQTKFFYKAFHKEGDLVSLEEARESMDVMDTIQESIVPFYFDHFLSLHGYQPNYNFKTQIELRDGPEVDRFQVKYIVPDVMHKFEKWQALKKKTMEDNIKKNPQMYRDLQI